MLRAIRGSALAFLTMFSFLSCTPSGVHAIIPLADSGLPAEGSIFDFGKSRDTEYHTDATCAATSSQIGLLPLDMLIALDTSFSMDFNGKWNAVSSAIKAFANNRKFAGLGVGIQYFPLRKQCNSDDYSLPAVPFALLPAVAQTIGQSLDRQRMSGGTPMVPMLEGVVKYARSWSTSNPKRRVVIVLATDGIPDDSCLAPPPGGLSNTIANVVKVAAAALAQAPKLKIFVVGVGTELTALNQISQAGGTGKAILVDTSKDIQGAFLAALDDIRRRALTCDHEIPPPSSGTIDFERVNVEFDKDGKTEIFIHVGDRSKCSKAPGRSWYYDDPLNPKKLVLCPQTCDKVQQSKTGKLDVKFGCKTIVL